jgi:hypothetical protein
MANVSNENTEVEINAVSDEHSSNEADKKLANMVNSAVTSQLKRHLSKFENSLSELKESFSSRQVSERPSDQHDKKSAKDDDSLAMREVERLKAELNAEKARVREEKAYTSLRNYLSDKVIPERVDVALKLFKADQKIHFRRDGTPIVKHDSEEFELEEGAAQWLKSKEAAMFLPAPNANKAASVAAKNLPFRTPAKVSTQNGQEQPSNPAAKTLLQLQKLGIDL